MTYIFVHQVPLKAASAFKFFRVQSAHLARPTMTDAALPLAAFAMATTISAAQTPRRSPRGAPAMFDDDPMRGRRGNATAYIGVWCIDHSARWSRDEAPAHMHNIGAEIADRELTPLIWVDQSLSHSFIMYMSNRLVVWTLVTFVACMKRPVRA